MAKIKQIKEPGVLEQKLAGLRPDQRRIVGLDLGTNCGVCWADFVPGAPFEEAVLVFGQLDLSIGQYDTAPTRLVRLKQFLSTFGPHMVAYEEVKSTPPAMQGRMSPAAIMARAAPAAELLGSLKAMMAVWCHENDVPAEGYPIGTIKKFATGKGNANKVQMIEAANEFFHVNLEVEDYDKLGTDNIADAMWVCRMCLEGNAQGLK